MLEARFVGPSKQDTLRIPPHARGYDTWRCTPPYGSYRSGMKPWIINARRRMRELGVRQLDLMPVLGVTTRGAVGHYLTGRRDLTGEQMHALAQFLGMTVEDLQGSPVAVVPAAAHRLSPDELALVEKYRASDEAAKRHLQAVSDALAQYQPPRVSNGDE